jgi:hypothetical protein
VNLVGACEPMQVTRSDNGLQVLKHLWKGIVERMMGVLGTYLDRGGFYSRLFQGRGGGSEIKWDQVQLNFSFRNKFITVLP